MKAVVFRGAAGSRVAGVEDRPDPTPPPCSVLIRPQFAGVNPTDLSHREGGYPAALGTPTDVPGVEVAGDVVAVGPRVKRWQIGDRVFGLVAGGGIAELVVAHQEHLIRVPELLDPSAAAAVPEVFITAHDAMRQGGLKTGELLVITGANGGVGTAAIQIGLAKHARVLAVARDAQARLTIAERYAVEVVSPEEYVQAALQRGGANVVVDVVGGQTLVDALDSLAHMGRIMVVGALAGRLVTIDLAKVVRRRATVRGTMLRSRSVQEKARAVQAFGREIVPLLGGGQLVPVVDSVFPLDRINEAFDRLASAGKFGKVLIALH